MEFVLDSGDVLFQVLHLGPMVDRFSRLEGRVEELWGVGAVDRVYAEVAKSCNIMRIVQDRGNCSIRVECNLTRIERLIRVVNIASLARVGIRVRRRKKCELRIFFVAERADRHIQRNCVTGTREVAIDLGLAVAPWINGQAETRRPVISEGIVHLRWLVVVQGIVVLRALHRLLFPAIAGVHSDVPVDLPRVADIRGVIAAVRIEGWGAEEASILQQHNFRRTDAGHVVQHT